MLGDRRGLEKVIELLRKLKTGNAQLRYCWTGEIKSHRITTEIEGRQRSTAILLNGRNQKSSNYPGNWRPATLNCDTVERAKSKVIELLGKLKGGKPQLRYYCTVEQKCRKNRAFLSFIENGVAQVRYCWTLFYRILLLRGVFDGDIDEPSFFTIKYRVRPVRF